MTDTATGYTIAQAAAKLGQDISTVRRHIKSGKLTATKDAKGRYRVQLDDNDTEPTSAHHEANGTADTGELGALRAHIATLTAEVEARRTAEAELRRLLMQAQSMVPTLHAPGDIDHDSAPRRHWWQRAK